MKLIRFKTPSGSDYAIVPTAVTWFTDISSANEGRTAIVLVGGATVDVPFTFDEFAAMWADAMRGDPGENERGPTP